MTLLELVSKSRKTTFFSTVCRHSVRDAILSIAVFGNKLNYYECSKMPQCANNRIIKLPSRNMYSTTNAGLHKIDTIDNFLQEVEEIDSDVFYKYLRSGSFINRSDTAYINTVLCEAIDYTAVAQSLPENYEGPFFGSVGSALFVWFINYSQNEIYIYDAFLSYDHFATKIRWDFCPLIITEGVSKAAYMFISPRERQAQTKTRPITLNDVMESWHSVFDNVESLQEDPDSTLEDILELDQTDAMKGLDLLLDTFVVNSPANNINENEARRRIKQFRKAAIRYIRRKEDVTDIDNFLRIESNRYLIVRPLDTNKWVTVQFSPLQFQLSFDGCYVIDSMLTYLLTQSGSYLANGLSSDFIQILIATTFSHGFGIYAPIGSKDPLKDYDFEAITSGRIFIMSQSFNGFSTDVQEGFKLDLEECIFYTSHRDYSRQGLRATYGIMTHRGHKHTFCPMNIRGQDLIIVERDDGSVRVLNHNLFDKTCKDECDLENVVELFELNFKEES